MPKQERQKQKLLVLKEFFERETDEAHPASMPEILAYLAARDIPAERKSVYSDIETLRDFGLDLCLRRGRGGGYYLASRAFELPELKLLVDAVQSSRFLTDRKSMALIGKLSALASRHDAARLQRQVVVSGRVKTMNESIYYNVDRIHDAILNNSQIRFGYFDWDLGGARRARPGPYAASPYALCWDHENYYLIAHSARHGLTHYRVDKMTRIQETGTPRVQTEETAKLDLAAYLKKTFGMFGGQEMTVRLRFPRRLAGVIYDRFGHDAMLIPDGEDHFTFTAAVVDSPLFYGWLAGFGGQAELLSPPAARQEFRAMLEDALALYAVDDA